MSTDVHPSDFSLQWVHSRMREKAKEKTLSKTKTIVPENYVANSEFTLNSPLPGNIRNFGVVKCLNCDFFFDLKPKFFPSNHGRASVYFMAPETCPRCNVFLWAADQREFNLAAKQGRCP